MKANKPTFKIEEELKLLGYKHIAGVDEAGRGPGAGPVVAAAVRMPPMAIETLKDVVNDSKKISEKKRLAICRDIISLCDVGIGSIDNNIIDDINIANYYLLLDRLRSVRIK